MENILIESCLFEHLVSNSICFIDTCYAQFEGKEGKIFSWCVLFEHASYMKR